MKQFSRIRAAATSIVTLLVLGGVLAACGSGTRSSEAAATDAPSSATRSVGTALRIPPLLAPRVDAQGRKVFDLTLQTGSSTFLPGKSTQTWGVNGAYLGPTLRASRGDRVVIHVHNQLPAMTTLHWHGMHLPAVDDGGPHQMIQPGRTWSPSWTIDQPATTLWYHPHPDGQTADQVYRGIAGLFILDDASSDALPLPDRYGVNDIPLIIQDRNFNSDGSLNLASTADGRLGNTILVNGTYKPHLNVGDERVRFRLLNGSDARIYNIGFADNRTFDLVGTDEGLLSHPVALSRIQLAPGERAEIVATFHAGEHVVLRSFAPNLDIPNSIPVTGNGGGLQGGGGSPQGGGSQGGGGPGGAGLQDSSFQGGHGGAGANGLAFERTLNGGGQSFDLLQIRAATRLRPSPAVPPQLATLPPLNVSAATRTRQFELDHTNAINGQQMDMNRIDFSVLAGSTEIWEVHGFLPHDFHVHGVSFRVIDIGGAPPPPQLQGLKDTVYVPPFTTVRLLVQFGNYADPHHPYMYHCHMLQHEDAGMMGQFVVIHPGQQSQVGVAREQ